MNRGSELRMRGLDKAILAGVYGQVAPMKNNSKGGLVMFELLGLSYRVTGLNFG